MPKLLLAGCRTLSGKARLCLRGDVTRECKPFLQFSGSAFHFNKDSLSETRWWSTHWCLLATRILSARWTIRTFGGLISGSACPAGTRSRTIQLDKHPPLLGRPACGPRFWQQRPNGVTCADSCQPNPKCADKFRSERKPRILHLEPS